MTKSTAALTPLPPEQWDEQIQPIAERLGNPLNIHRIIAHNPVLMNAYTPLRYHIVRDSSLSPRQRELIILRTAHNCQSDYEWTHHVARGREAGLTDEEIERVRAGAHHLAWSEAEIALLLCADEMFHHTELHSRTLDLMAAHYSKEQLLDTIYTIGVYITLGTILKSFSVPLETGPHS